MSTNFDVYPCIEYIPTYKEILNLANKNLKSFISKLGISSDISLNVELYSINDNSKIDFNIEDKVILNEEMYAWFFIKDIAGGTDLYYFKITGLDKDAWQEEYITNSKVRLFKSNIDKSIELGYHWSFRRTAGQPGIIHLSYGLLAASLAQLTQGFLYSDDGAWEYSYFPAFPDDFFEWYFNPEFISQNSEKDFVVNSIESIKSQFK
jgi:hypothetical protein